MLGRFVEALVPRRVSMLLSILVLSIPQITVAQNDPSTIPNYQANAQAVIVDVVVTGGQRRDSAESFKTAIRSGRRQQDADHRLL